MKRALLAAAIVALAFIAVRSFRGMRHAARVIDWSIDRVTRNV